MIFYFKNATASAILFINYHMEKSNTVQNKKNNQEIIKQLKEQVHKSFLQISEMEKLYTMEIQHTKKIFQQKQQQLRLKQQQINKKLIENKAKSGQDNALNRNFMLDLGTFDDSNLLEDISFKTEPDMKDSNIYTLTKMLSAGNQNLEMQQQLRKLKELQNIVLSEIKTPTQNLFKIFRKANQYCMQNIRLRQELLNSNENNQIYKNKIQENTAIIIKLKSIQMTLKNQNQALNKQIQQQKINMQAVTKHLHSEIQSKNKMIFQMKQNIQKLIEVLKSHSIKSEEYSQYIESKKKLIQVQKQEQKQKNGQSKKKLSINEKMIWHSGIKHLNITPVQNQLEPKRTNLKRKNFDKKNSILRQ